MCLASAVVLARTEELNQDFARELQKREEGLEIIHAPTAKYVDLQAELPDFFDFDRIILSSQASLRFMPSPHPSLKFMVVGEQTARILRNLKVREVEVFDDINALAQSAMVNSAQSFLYLRGADVRMDLVPVLCAKPARIEEVKLYRMEPLSWSEEFYAEIQRLDCLIIPLFSQNSYLRLVDHMRKIKNDSQVTFLPISEKLGKLVAHHLEASKMGYRVAPAPKRPQRFEFIDKIIDLYKKQDGSF